MQNRREIMRNILLTACAIASIAAPALSLAQGYDDHAARDQRAGRQDVRQDPRADSRQDIRQDVRHDNRADADHARVWAPGNRTWWRGRPEFAGYAGARAGFWFVPGRGYVNPGPRWFGYGWRVGGFVPPALREYAVVDPYVYGLPPARFGFRYVYLANDVALIRMGDGRIVTIVPNVY
jgi:Ni/Co efflux regulator RcnB